MSHVVMESSAGAGTRMECQLEGGDGDGTLAQVPQRYNYHAALFN